MSKGSACVCHVTDGSLCSLRGCFIHREHSFLDASHAAFVESSTMWPYACLSDCKVMVKCVESDGKVIATHVSVQSHHQPVRSDREGCRHPSCVSCMRHCQAAPWVHALPTVLVRWVRLFHSLPPAATPGTFLCCHGCWVGGIGFIRCHRLPLLEPSCVVTVHAGVLIMSFDLIAMQPSCSLHGRVIRVCPIARMYASVTVLGRWVLSRCMRACHSCVSHRQDVRECNGAG